MTHEVNVARAAERDIRLAFEWWRDNRSANEAERWIDEIHLVIGTLSENPERCPIAPETDFVPTGLRQLHFGIGRKSTHRIVFTIDDQRVVVLRVRHVAQRDLTQTDLA